MPDLFFFGTVMFLAGVLVGWRIKVSIRETAARSEKHAPEDT